MGERRVNFVIFQKNAIETTDPTGPSNAIRIGYIPVTVGIYGLSEPSHGLVGVISTCNLRLYSLQLPAQTLPLNGAIDIILQP